MDTAPSLLFPQGDPSDPAYRRRCGTRSGLVGIVLNLLLCGGKLLAGWLTASVAVMADAINNLSDAAASVMTLVGFRIAGMEADEHHPFGHGRAEYLSGLVVSLAILLMGLEVGRAALDALLHPKALVFSPLSTAILLLSILVKLWLAWFNRTLGRRIGSAAMAATAADARSDALSTTMVLLSTLAARFLHLQVDGWVGLVVAALILKAGWEAARDTLDPLLGRPMDPALAQDIDRIVLGHENILGMHDLVYHDYGPGRAMMSFHAEVPAEGDLLVLHDLIDHIEKELRERHHIETVIHMDPVVRDERTLAMKAQVTELVWSVDDRLSIHDFRMVPGPTHTNLIFDLSVPYAVTLSEETIRRSVTEKLERLGQTHGTCYCPVFEVEHSYVAYPDKK